MPTSVASSRVRLSRDELHQLRWLLGLALALLACWTLFELDTHNFGELAVVTLLIAAALAFPSWPGAIPGWMRRLALPAALGVLLWKISATDGEVLPCLVLVVLLLMFFRSLQYRRRREDWQLLLLCLFAIVLSGVLTLSILFGLQILLFTLLAMALLFVMNLVERDAARALAREDWRHFHWPSFLRRLRHALDVRLLLLFFGLFGVLVAVGTLIFVAIPRFQFEQAFSITRLRGAAGFSNSIEYADEKDLEPDDTVVLRVDVPADAAFTAPPYWRMIVFDQYTGKGFRPSPALNSKIYEQRTTRYVPRFWNHVAGVPRPAGRWRFFMEGNVSEYLPLLGACEQIAFQSTQSVRELTHARVFRLDTPTSSFLPYEVAGMDMGDFIPAAQVDEALKLPPAGGGNLTPDRLRELEENARRRRAALDNASNTPLSFPLSYYFIPSGDRDYLLKAAAEIRRGAADLTAAEFCARAVAYLRDRHQTSRSVNVSAVTSGKDSLVKWMASGSPGWCEYFAGALTLLARAGGYPARIAAGYKGASFNTIEEYYVVRQSDAHAWVEVFDGNAWLRVDPTPGDALVAAAASRAAVITTESGWAAWLDSLRMLWYRRVVNFDRSDQEQIAETLAGWTKSLGAKLRAWTKSAWDRLYDWASQPFTAEHGLAAISLAVLLGGLWYLRGRIYQAWLWLRGRVAFVRAGPGAPLRRAAGRWLRRFQPVWREAAVSLTPAERMPWDAARLDLLALRYGPPGADVDAAAAFRQAKELLRHAKSTFLRSR